MTVLHAAPSESTRAALVWHDAGPPDRVVVAGDIEGPAVARFQHVLGAVCKSATSVVLVDMSCVSFLGMAGLHALVDARKRTAAANVELLLVRPSAAVTRLLACTGLTKLFPLAADRTGRDS